jgi:hypothetical protein
MQIYSIHFQLTGKIFWLLGTVYNSLSSILLVMQWRKK